MRVLVLGGYGMIGIEIARCLSTAGHEVIGLGRSATGRRLLPHIRWVLADIARLDTPHRWLDCVTGVNVVVNAAGALQSGSRDNLEAVHDTAVAALVSACRAAGVTRLVQISAPRARVDATTEFLRSKSRGDARVRASGLQWVIVRPGLVVGPNAYGGTALIRTLASFPVVQPIVSGDRLVQTVALADLTQVVLDAVDGRIPAGSDFDLVEDEVHTLESVVRDFRIWLGFGPALKKVAIPESLGRVVAGIGDALGYLGWRPPLRTTTMRVIAENVIGNAEEFRAVSHRRLSTLQETLRRMPSTLQERWFARLNLLMPLVFGVLALFWILSGLVALLEVDTATAWVVSATLSLPTAKLLVVGGAVIDIGLGFAILHRRSAKAACLGMIAITLLYLVGATVLRPDLWADPLGPLLKAVPAAMLAAMASILLEER